jgi:hypothetical protein
MSLLVQRSRKFCFTKLLSGLLAKEDAAPSRQSWSRVFRIDCQSPEDSLEYGMGGACISLEVVQNQIFDGPLRNGEAEN